MSSHVQRTVQPPKWAPILSSSFEDISMLPIFVSFVLGIFLYLFSFGIKVTLLETKST